MKLSRAYIPTQKETPSDAVIPSHRLMIRAGLVRPLAAGVYSVLPLGWKVMRRIMGIIRQEMDRIGAQELHLPVLNPVEIWDETGRNADFGDEIFRLKDRKGRPLLLAPTHEEIICDLARKAIRSYKDLPQMWYQIQTKFRDEPRPRSGVIRTRQFFMKDSYSLDADETGLDLSYRLHAGAYEAIFRRCGLTFHLVGASSGLMGGKVSQEFMFESEFGEDTLAICDGCGYAANLDIAVSRPVPVPDRPGGASARVHTPQVRTIEEVSDFLKRPRHAFIKAVLVVSQDRVVMALLRGDHNLNEAKLQSRLGAPFRPAHPEEILEACGAEAGFVGPVGLPGPVLVLADEALNGGRDFAAGANLNDHHLTGVEPGRDFPVDRFEDLRNTVPGDACASCGKPLRVVNAIELGHIFKLGTKYSAAMKAEFLDPQGAAKPIVMGSYGIGVERILAAALEQGHDDNGIVWNKVLTPYHAHLIPVKMDKPDVVEAAEALYAELTGRGMECLFDDRPVSPGFKFKDADLIGVPLQIVVGEKWVADRKVEMKDRKTGKRDILSATDAVASVMDFYRE